MIAEKIAEARKAKQKKLLMLGAFITVVVILATLLIYITMHFKLVRQVMPEQENVTPTVGAPTQSTSHQKKEANSALSDVPPEPSPQPPPDIRKTYLDAYQQYENHLKPQLNQIALERWNKTLSDQILVSEKTAIETFSAADYTSALSEINELTQLAEKTIEQSQNEYNDAISAVEKAYTMLDYDVAKREFNKASMHQSNAQEIDSLSEKIENIPQIRSLEEEIRIARVQNEPVKELKAIRELIKIDPQRGDYSQRAEILTSQLSTARFNQAIAEGYKAVENKKIATARTQLNKAKTLSQSRQEIQQLSQAIEDVERTLRLDENISKANIAESKDEWDKVNTALTNALKDNPDNEPLTNRLEKAKTILVLKEQMTTLLKHPYRLAVDSVKIRANKTLARAEPYSDDSASLSVLSKELAQTLNAVNKNVSVELLSDGLTTISVRGVGHVGKVTSKTITLKPGSYIFEGKRDGYKSKIVEVTIPINTSSIEMRVIADERI